MLFTCSLHVLSLVFSCTKLVMNNLSAKKRASEKDLPVQAHLLLQLLLLLDECIPITRKQQSEGELKAQARKTAEKRFERRNWANPVEFL